MIRRIVTFDLDGTLADTVGEMARAADAALADLGLPPLGTAATRAAVGGGGRLLMRRLLARHGEPDGARAEQAFLAFQRRYEETVGTDCAAYPGAHEAVERLARAGVAMGCVTNKDEAFARRVLDCTGLAAAMAIVVGGDTLAVRKPDGRVLRHAVAALGGDVGDALHVGDSRTDLEAARNAGVACWLVTFGYDGGEPVAQLGADRLIESFDELAATFESLHPPAG